MPILLRVSTDYLQPVQNVRRFGVRVQRVAMPDGDVESWTVLDASCRVVEPIEQGPCPRFLDTGARPNVGTAMLRRCPRRSGRWWVWLDTVRPLIRIPTGPRTGWPVTLVPRGDKVDGTNVRRSGRAGALGRCSRRSAILRGNAPMSPAHGRSSKRRSALASATWSSFRRLPPIGSGPTPHVSPSSGRWVESAEAPTAVRRSGSSGISTTWSRSTPNCW